MEARELDDQVRLTRHHSTYQEQISVDIQLPRWNPGASHDGLLPRWTLFSARIDWPFRPCWRRKALSARNGPTGPWAVSGQQRMQKILHHLRASAGNLVNFGGKPGYMWSTKLIGLCG
jgi:hypothetical protein